MRQSSPKRLYFIRVIGAVPNYRLIQLFIRREGRDFRLSPDRSFVLVESDVREVHPIVLEIFLGKLDDILFG